MKLIPSELIRVEPDGAYWRLVVDGRVVIAGETMVVCDNVREALVQGRYRVGSECDEVADSIREKLA